MASEGGAVRTEARKPQRRNRTGPGVRLSQARRLLSREHKSHRGEDSLPRCVQYVWAREELPAEDGGQRGRRGASEVGDAGGEVAGPRGLRLFLWARWEDVSRF